MKVTYYTIDDLRLGHDPKGITGWRLSRFLSLDRALEHYRTMSPAGMKALGLSDGEEMLELVRCQPLMPGDDTGEDVLASDYQTFPLWKNVPEASEAMEVCVSSLRIRYLLKKDRLVPIPAKKKLAKRFQGLRLRMKDTGNPESSIRWAYVVGEGLVPAETLNESRPFLPLVLSYQVECMAEDGSITTLEMTPWEYEQLAHRSKERCA